MEILKYRVSDTKFILKQQKFYLGKKFYYPNNCFIGFTLILSIQNFRFSERLDLVGFVVSPQITFHGQRLYIQSGTLHIFIKSVLKMPEQWNFPPRPSLRFFLWFSHRKLNCLRCLDISILAAFCRKDLLFWD